MTDSMAAQILLIMKFNMIRASTSGLTEREYTITGLTIGIVYTFQVKARNSFGYSDDWSTTLSALCAGPPLAPIAPITTTATNADIQI
jgi:hypothetical protein